jgi:hypothetical protein
MELINIEKELRLGREYALLGNYEESSNYLQSVVQSIVQFYFSILICTIFNRYLKTPGLDPSLVEEWTKSKEMVGEEAKAVYDLTVELQGFRV